MSDRRNLIVLLPPYLTSHQSSIPIIRKPQPLGSVVAHESAERNPSTGTVVVAASLGSKGGVEITAGFGVDELAVGELEFAAVVFAQVGVFAVFPI